MAEENGSSLKARHKAQQRDRDRDRDRDRVSRLPDELLHRIMSLLSLQNAVGTCAALSRRWRYLWRTLPYLNFDLLNYSFEGAKKDNDTQQPQEEEYVEANWRSFCNFIMQFLLRRSSSAGLVRVRFDSSAIRNNSAADFVVDTSVIESLIWYAFDHQVQELDICAFFSQGFRFPSCFTSCQLLTTFKLEVVQVVGKGNDNDSDSEDGDEDEDGDGDGLDADDDYTLDMKRPLFPALHTFHLVRFHVANQRFFSWLFSDSPNLRHLKLVDVCFDGVGSLSIQAPNLKSLEFIYTRERDGPFYPRGFKVKLDTPNLTHFKFHGYDNPIWCLGCNLLSLDEVDFVVSRNDFVEEHQHCPGSVNPLTMFSHAKTLTLSTKTIQALFGHPALVESQLQFPNLKSLKISVDWEYDFQIPTSLLIKLMRNSPILKIGQQ